MAGCLLAVAAIPAMFAYNGLALMLLWRWFVAEPFGVPALSVPHSIGLSMFAVVFARHIPRDEDDRAEMLIHELVSPGLAVAVGYLVKLWM